MVVARSTRATKLAMIMIFAVGTLIPRLSLARAAEKNSTASSRARTEATPSHPSTHKVRAALDRATTLLEAGRYQDAVHTIESLSCLCCDPRISLLLAAALEGAGNRIKARRTLEQGHSFWPSNNSIATALARQYLLIGRANEAAEALAPAHVGETTPMQELTLRVEVYLAVNRLQDAERVAEIACKAHPSEESDLLLANVLQMQGRPQDVIRLLQNKRISYGNSPSFLITLAESEYDTRMYEAARADLTRAASLDPQSDIAHYLLGNTLVKLRETNQAVREYHAAIRLAPGKPRTHYHLALALLKLGDEADAEGCLKQALSLDRRYAPAYLELGQLFISQNRAPEAIEKFKEAIKYEPALEPAYYLLARAYARMGDKRDSQETFKRFLAVRKANRKRAPPRNQSNPPASGTR